VQQNQQHRREKIMMKRTKVTSRPYRTVRFQGRGSLGHVRNLLALAADAPTHEKRGRALDEAAVVFNRIYEKAEKEKG
jgi:hypothetical protein